jgi:hypothetical protein
MAVYFVDQAQIGSGGLCVNLAAALGAIHVVNLQGLGLTAERGKAQQTTDEPRAGYNLQRR